MPGQCECWQICPQPISASVSFSPAAAAGVVDAITRAALGDAQYEGLVRLRTGF